MWHGIKGFRNSPYNERMVGCTFSSFSSLFPPSHSPSPLTKPV